MKHKTVWMPALIAAVLLVTLAGVGCGGSTTATSGSMMGSTTSGGMMSGTSAGTMMGNTTSSSMMNAGTTGGMNGGTRVVMKGFAFSPVSVTIKVGDTVIWENQDAATHNVIADDGSFSSPDFGQGGTFSFVFTKAGTYTYSCRIHPNMKGTVIVQ